MKVKSQRINLKSLYPDEIPKATYLTHGFDRYPAKMIPHMARFLIEKISEPGHVILDPFCGSGAVLTEALLCRRHAIGVDINPLATLIAETKTRVYDPDTLDRQREWLLEEFQCCCKPHQYDYPNASYWFTPATLRKLGAIKRVIDENLSNFEPEYSGFWRALTATIVRACSKADTRGPKPFISKRARERRCGRHFDPFKIFESKAREWISIEREFEDRMRNNGHTYESRVLEGDTRALSSLLPDQQVDAIVTSPPYVNAQDYYRASKLELFTLGITPPEKLKELSRQLVGSDRIHAEQSLVCDTMPSCLAQELRDDLAVRNRKNACVFAKYVLDMSVCFGQIHEVLRDTGHCAIVSGYNLISGIAVPTHEVLSELACDAGFELIDSYVDKIRDRWVPTIRNGHNGVIEYEYLMIFRKSK
jgi:DNA modification methylase